MKIAQVGFIVLIAISLSGCGKSLEQIKKTAHDLIEIAGSVYQDVKENVEKAKDTVVGEKPIQ